MLTICEQSLEIYIHLYNTYILMFIVANHSFGYTRSLKGRELVLVTPDLPKMIQV